ncbi:lysozyme inhibitor LprI family protein [Acinetobacter nectaris]|uniref:lysozyme inhibitor LprI family protein n=1 Tax=Acinetobacter nectaris TaxID=1219382 RepID=UPI001F235B74|nr:lysozyme inhibitor LprI family protein [Acinetobacter nectaris]MCF8998131.1 DUF1311 domain-containing protein [Acinetobacter nectaris]MCF9026943.1 DUF1311 domain-containing protein [Acinetobacter nectaris]
MKRAYVFIVFAILSCGVFARDCKNAISQSDMNICANIAFKESDRMLNDTFQKIISSKDIGFQKILKQAQRSWIKFRDDDCTVQSYPTREGSVQPMIYANCLKEKTDLRIADLNKILTCEEGDLACQLH